MIRLVQFLCRSEYPREAFVGCAYILPRHRQLLSDLDARTRHLGSPFVAWNRWKMWVVRTHRTGDMVNRGNPMQIETAMIRLL